MGASRSPAAQLIHQIGNSVGAVGLHAQVLSRLVSAPAEQEHVQSILREVRAASGLLEGLRGLLAPPRRRKSSP